MKKTLLAVILGIAVVLSAGQVYAADVTLWDFPSNIDGWAYENNDGFYPVQTVAFDGGMSRTADGTGSLTSNLTYQLGRDQAGYVKWDETVLGEYDKDFSGYTKIWGSIYIPSDMPVGGNTGGGIVVQTGGDWSWYQAPWTNFTHGWNDLEFRMDAALLNGGGLPVAVTSPEYVKTVGITIYGGGSVDGNFDVNLDDFKATPIPEPSSLLLLGTGLTGLFGFGFKRRKK